MADRKRKEKSNREKKNGYSHDQWLERKQKRNETAPKQTFDKETKTWQRP